MSNPPFSFQEQSTDEVLAPHLFIAEPSLPFLAALSERDLHEFWRKQLFHPSHLRVSSGEFVEVVYPGDYNRDAGPDFRHATLKLGGKIIQGDVELHLRARDWVQHAHHTDPAYNAVVLHLALRHADEHEDIVRENGLPVAQVLLEANDLPVREPEPRVVAECPLSRTSPEKILATVRRAGQFRLEQKASAFAELLVQTSWDQAVYQGLAEALGYDKNQEAFRLLAKIAPIDLLFSESRAHAKVDPGLLLEALLYGAAGFLEADAAAVDEEIRSYLAPRRQWWERLSHPLRLRPLPRSAWRFFRLRPANFPTRRLAGLAALLQRFAQHGMLEHFLRMLQGESATRKAQSLELIGYFVVPAEGFWERRCDFESRAVSASNPRYGDLIGANRALDIIVNVILPALLQHALHSEDSRLMTALRELYAYLPSLQTNVITRRMTEQLSQRFALGQQIAKGAQSQQGLLYLQKLLCRSLHCDACLRIATTIRV
jgi:hypothetical protein